MVTYSIVKVRVLRLFIPRNEEERITTDIIDDTTSQNCFSRIQICRGLNPCSIRGSPAGWEARPEGANSFLLVAYYTEQMFSSQGNMSPWRIMVYRI